jgi:hypothetical protein
MLSGKSLIFKVLLIAVIVSVPLTLSVVILAPFVPPESGNKYDRYYRVRLPLTRDEFQGLMDRMRSDPEFAPYYRYFPVAAWVPLREEVISLMEGCQDAESWHHRMLGQKTLVEHLAVILNDLNFPAGFRENRLKYPEFSRVLEGFFREEFKLTFIAVIYKANFDGTFRLQWNEGTRRAAKKWQTFYDF